MKRFSQNFLPESFRETWVRNSLRNIGENEIQLGNFNQQRPCMPTWSSSTFFLFTIPPKFGKIIP